MQAVLRSGFDLDQLLADGPPQTETLYVVPAGQQDISLGGGRYVPDRIYAVYRDPARTFDAVCLVVTPEGSGETRTARVTATPRGREQLKGDLRIPLDAIEKAALAVAGTGRGPVLPPGSLHPTGASYTPDVGGTNGRRRRVYHTIDDRRLAEVAWVVGRSAREGHSTRGAVAATWGIAEATAAEWISRAREAGMLPEVNGKRNPSVEDNQPTHEALGILSEKEDDDEQ